VSTEADESGGEHLSGKRAREQILASPKIGSHQVASFGRITQQATPKAAAASVGSITSLSMTAMSCRHCVSKGGDPGRASDGKCVKTPNDDGWCRQCRPQRNGRKGQVGTKMCYTEPPFVLTSWGWLHTSGRNLRCNRRCCGRGPREDL